MKKILLLFALGMTFMAAQAGRPVISVDSTSLDFGVGYNGYSVCRTIHVTGTDLTDNINLSLTGSDAIDFIIGGPQTITPAQAARGVDVTLRFYPFVDERYCHASLVLASAGAHDVTVPLKGYGIKTSSRIKPETDTLEFETAVGQSISQRITVTDTYFSGWIAGSGVFPDIIATISWMSAEVEGSPCFAVEMVSSTFPSQDVNKVVFKVTYTPFGEGPHNARLVLHGYKTPPYYVELIGNTSGEDTGRYAPVVLMASDYDVTATSLVVHWFDRNTPSDVAGYTVECCTNNTFDAESGDYHMQSTPSSRHYALFWGLEPEATYYYRVRAQFTDGEWSAWSRVLSVTLHDSDFFLSGDVNNDGSLSLADLAALVKAIINEEWSDVNVTNADVTNDGRVTVGDVASLINLLLMAN